MKKVLHALAAAAVMANLGLAQELAVTVSPNPAPLGATINVTAQGTVSGLYTPFGCLLYSVHAGTPTGPTVRIFGCVYLPGAIPTYGAAATRTAAWNQAVSTSYSPTGFATPGLYWLELERQPQQFGGPVTSEWFSVVIDDPANAAPVLSAAGAATFGSTFSMSLAAGQSHGLEPYGVAFSLTTNTGIQVPGGPFVSLDPDWLFNDSISLDPFVFVNTAAQLDWFGTSPQIVLNIPPVVGTLIVPIHAQAVVFTASGGLLLSNDLPIVVH
jgi:hypothetical protein